MRQVSLLTTKDVYRMLYDYRRQDREYHYFHYCRHVNVYFLYFAPCSNRSENARFEGITPR